MNPFLTEIFQQPKAVRDTTAYHQSHAGQRVLHDIKHLWDSGICTKLIFTGMGSSYFISEAAACLFNSYGMDACAINSGELLHYRSALIVPGTLLICVSQSGESYEVVRLLEKVGSDVKVIAVTNEPDSTLAKRADHVVISVAGKEEMTSTKTFITSWQNILVLFRTLVNESWSVDVWEKVAVDIETILASCDDWMENALESLGSASFIQLVGRGPSFAAVSQSRLMFMEASHTPASALLGGEFRHGPLEMVGEGFVAILFAHSRSKTYALMTGLADDLISYGAKVIFVTDADMVSSDRMCVINVPCEEEHMFVIQSVIPIQLLIDEWSCRKGMIPGDFTHGHKVTCRE